MKYLIENFSDLDSFTLSDFKKSIETLESSFYSSIQKTYETDTLKFYKYLCDSIDELFKKIKFIKNKLKNSEDKKLSTLLQSYNEVYKKLELEYKPYYPNAFKKNYEFWSLKDYQSPFLDNIKHNPITQFNYPKNLEEHLHDDDRQAILESFLIDQKAIKKYHHYEKKLIHRGFINKERNKWEKPSINFVRFIYYCAEKKVLKNHYRGDDFIDVVKGMKVLYFKNNFPSDYEKIAVAKKHLEKVPNKFNFLD